MHRVSYILPAMDSDLTVPSSGYDPQHPPLLPLDTNLAPSSDESALVSSPETGSDAATINPSLYPFPAEHHHRPL
ncbi:unnamed protein product [Linum trigynum]|uniref:Uncharacterized protein n=1 Tax=Linum trigynum TaxID=586398 RepID=A0AAV2DA34_9ROSI